MVYGRYGRYGPVESHPSPTLTTDVHNHHLSTVRAGFITQLRFPFLMSIKSNSSPAAYYRKSVQYRCT